MPSAMGGGAVTATRLSLQPHSREQVIPLSATIRAAGLSPHSVAQPYCRARPPLAAVRQAREPLPPTSGLAGHQFQIARAASLDPDALVRGAAAFGRANRGTPPRSGFTFATRAYVNIHSPLNVAETAEKSTGYSMTVPTWDRAMVTRDRVFGPEDHPHD